MIGQQIGRYRIERMLGEGGMGSVYLASHVNISGQKAAVKSLHSAFAGNSDVRSRFKREAETLASLKHPNIVTLYDYVENDQGLFLVMEYVDGIDLGKHIDTVTGPIPEKQAIDIFGKVLDACAFAHNNGVVHRDIKPSNIMISQRGEVKVLDFGIVKLVTKEVEASFTKTGTKIGTVMYMSPEQVKGQNVTKTSDIYSAGVTLFEMVTGKLPYDENQLSEFEIQTRIVHEDLPRAKTIYPGVSDGMQAVIDKATAKKASDRYPDCLAFKRDLLSFSGGNHEQTRVEQNPSQRSSPQSGLGKSKITVTRRIPRNQPTVDHSLNTPPRTQPPKPPVNKPPQPTHETPVSSHLFSGANEVPIYKKPVFYIPVIALLVLGLGLGSFFFFRSQQMKEYLANGYNGFISGDYDAALEWYGKADERGSAEAAYYLGELYFNGAGVPKNVDKGIEYTKKAQEGGFCMAEWRMGMAYISGEGVMEDESQGDKLIREGIPCLEDLAAKGNAEAQANLGSAYISGDGVAKDVKQGLKWMKQAADQGYTIPIHSLIDVHSYGLIDDDGDTLGIDLDQAYKYAVQLRDDDFFKSDISFRLGQMYDWGNGVKEDNDSAMYYYERAADSDTGYTYKVYVGFAYQKQSDYIKAYEYYEEAAKDGDPMAQYGMGDLSYIGKPNGKDYYEAFSWYSKAAKQGFAPAQYWLGHMRQNGIGTSTNKTLAREHYLEAANGLDEMDHYEEWVMKRENLIPELANKLGVMYIKGDGGESDYEGAASLFELAYEYNHGWGTYNLGYCYATGKGKPEEPQKGYELYLRAIDLAREDNDETLVGSAYYQAGQLYERTYKKTDNQDFLIDALCLYYEGKKAGNESCGDAIKLWKREFDFDIDDLCR